MKLFNSVSLIIGAVGGFLINALGGYDLLLDALIWSVALDWVTAILGAIYNKTLSSRRGFKGIVKTVMIFCCVALSVKVSGVIGKDVRPYVILFFFANNGISILENATKFLNIPLKLKDILIQLRGDKIG